MDSRKNDQPSAVGFVSIRRSLRREDSKKSLKCVIVERFASEINAWFASPFPTGQFVPKRVAASFKKRSDDPMVRCRSDKYHAIALVLKSISPSENLTESAQGAQFGVLTKQLLRQVHAPSKRCSKLGRLQGLYPQYFKLLDPLGVRRLGTLYSRRGFQRDRHELIPTQLHRRLLLLAKGVVWNWWK